MSIATPRRDSSDHDPNAPHPIDRADAPGKVAPEKSDKGDKADKADKKGLKTKPLADRRAPGLGRGAKGGKPSGTYEEAVEAGDPDRWRRAFPSQHRQRQQAKGTNWPVAGWLIAIHVLALAAPFCFTWEGLALAVFMHWVTGSLGVCLGYHRLLTHMGFQTYRPVRWFLALLGGLSGEGSAISWTADHRQHHAFSDQEGDPHSPGDGSWWSHMLWLGWTMRGEEHQKHVQHWVPDLLKDRGLVWLDKLFLPSHIALGLAFGAIGYWHGGWPMALSLVVWGMFVRLVAVLHTTWFVNSASHIWGYRNYPTTDQSRNLWWVALISYGEGWHNNHHAYPRMAKHGHRWWEFDMTYRVIQLLQLCGLAWDVVTYRDHHEKAAAEARKRGVVEA